MEGGTWRTRLTLSDLLAVQRSSNLRDLLGYQEEEDGGHQAFLRRRGETLTLASALAYEKGEASSTSAAVAAAAAASGRTLLDILREDESLVAAGAGDNFTWTAFEEHLRLSAALAAASGRDPPATNGGAPTEEALAEGSADGGDDAAVPVAAEEQQQQPVRVSLMALLEATEGQMGGLGEVWAVAEEEGEEMTGGEEEEEEEEEGSHVCCVCAERRKGAAFIPCGHTFCRVCSRVLFKRRGSCPLCNAHIAQVLRIF